MDVTNWINLALLVLTAIGVIITVVQARAAHRDKDAAKRLADDALAASKSAAKAAERSADANERQAAAAEAQVRKDPWRVERISDHWWKVTNDTGNKAEFTRIHGKPPGKLTVEGHSEGNFIDIEKGESVFIQFGGTLTDPPSLLVTIDWKAAGGSGESMTVTIP